MRTLAFGLVLACAACTRTDGICTTPTHAVIAGFHPDATGADAMARRADTLRLSTAECGTPYFEVWRHDTAKPREVATVTSAGGCGS